MMTSDSPPWSDVNNEMVADRAPIDCLRVELCSLRDFSEDHASRLVVRFVATCTSG